MVYAPLASCGWQGGVDHAPCQPQRLAFWKRAQRSCWVRSVLKGLFVVSVIRFTVTDRQGTASFVGPCHAIKMVVAACSRHPETIDDLLRHTRPYDPDFVSSVWSGLTVFDEHCTPDEPAGLHRLLSTTQSRDLPPFRVIDDASREASLEPVDTGLILINLAARRIVQVQNSYADVQRADRGRVRRQGKPTPLLYHYRLPAEWRIVP